MRKVFLRNQIAMPNQFINPAIKCIIFYCILLLVGCHSHPEVESTVYSPTYSPDSSHTHNIIIGMPAQFMNDAFDPFIQFINRKKVGITVKVVMCQSYKDYNEKMRNGFFDIVFANPADALNIMNNGYSVFGKLSRDDLYRAVIITRKDSNIKTIADLKNGSISFPGPSAFAGTMLPLYFFYQQGLNVNQDIKPQYVASQESTFYNVFLGKSVAAGCWIMPWKHFQITNPDIASKLCVKWETPALISSAMMARNNLDTLYLGKFKKILFTLQENPEGRKLLESIGLGNFIAATNNTYDPVKEFLKKYHSVIHL